MRLDRVMLERGLQEVLISPSADADLPYFNYRTLAEGTTTAVLGIQFTRSRKWKHGKKGTENVIVKWYHHEPVSEEEPIYVGDNKTDILYLREQRNMSNVKEIVKGSFLPEVYGFSANCRLIVMEHLGKKTRNAKFLHEAEKLSYTGEGDLPSSLESSLLETIHQLALFNGICHARAEEFTRRHNYAQEADSRRWVGSYAERLQRLCNHAKVTDLVDITGALSSMQEQAQLFEKERDFYHGDFNLLQVIGQRMVDFERFGLYGQGRDFATLCLIAGFDNSAALYLNRKFTLFFDHYVTGVAIGKRRDNINTARAELRAIPRDPDRLHSLAVKECGGEERYADLLVGVWYQALNNLVRMGAAFDRMYEHQTRFNGGGDLAELNRKMGSVYKGIDTIFNLSGDATSTFERASDGTAKRDFFYRYHSLLTELKLLR